MCSLQPRSNQEKRSCRNYEVLVLAHELFASPAAKSRSVPAGTLLQIDTTWFCTRIHFLAQHFVIALKSPAHYSCGQLWCSRDKNHGTCDRSCQSKRRRG